MARHLSLADAIAEHVHDGDTVALEGFTHLIPSPPGHEIIRQGRRDLTLVRMTPDVVYDQLIGAGCARKLVFSWGGNPGVGSLHRFREAVQTGWPVPLEIEEHSHAGMAARYVAGASGLPFAVLRGYIGTDLPDRTDTIRTDRVPVHRRDAGRGAGAQPRRRDHPRPAGRPGRATCRSGASPACRRRPCWPPTARSSPSRRSWTSSATPYGAVVLPGWAVTAVPRCPAARRPSYAAGYSVRDNDAYQAGTRSAATARPSSSGCARPCTPGGDRMSAEHELDRRRDDDIEAARALHGVQSCFVGIGLPSTAANLARTTHAPDLVLVYESGCLGSKPDSLPLSIGDGGAGRDRDLGGLGPRDLQLLAAARPDRGRLPRRGPDRPARQHQHHRDRRRTTTPRCACPAQGARPRSPPRAVR